MIFMSNVPFSNMLDALKDLIESGEISQDNLNQLKEQITQRLFSEYEVRQWEFPPTHIWHFLIENRIIEKGILRRFIGYLRGPNWTMTTAWRYVYYLVESEGFNNDELNQLKEQIKQRLLDYILRNSTIFLPICTIGYGIQFRISLEAAQ